MRPQLPAGTSSASRSRYSSREDVLARRRRGELRPEQVEEPAERPHAAAHAAALVEIRAGDAGEVRPEVHRLLAVLVPVHHGGDVRAQRDERRALVERARAERLDRLVVGGGHDRQALRDAGRRRRVGGHVAGDVARHLQLDQQLRAHVELLEQLGVPLPRVGVDGPLQDDVVGGAVAELPGEPVGHVAGRGGGVGELGIVREPGLVRARVHPAHDRLEQRAVGLEEGLAAADGAQADAEDVRRVAGEPGHHLAARRDDGLPEVVVGMHGVPRPAGAPSEEDPAWRRRPRCPPGRR